jgi:hypothetical protein
MTPVESAAIRRGRHTIPELRRLWNRCHSVFVAMDLLTSFIDDPVNLFGGRRAPFIFYDIRICWKLRRDVYSTIEMPPPPDGNKCHADDSDAKDGFSRVSVP